MTSSPTRNLRRHDPVHNQYPPPYGVYYSEEKLWDRLSQPSVLVPAIVLLVTVVYHYAHNQAASRGRQLPSVADLIWDGIVFVCPAGLLYAVDRWVNPLPFPMPMLQPQPTTHAAKSDVLRKILRTDQNGGIVASVSEAGRRTLSKTFSGPRGKSDQPAGLSNWDNSCFQNSILQGLASLKHLPRYLSGASGSGQSPAIDKTTTAGTLYSFVAELNDTSNNGKTLYTPSVLKNMSTIQQQDAQEYFSRLVDQIDKDIEKAAKAACRQPVFEIDLSKDDTAASQHSDDSGYQSLPMLSKAGSELVTLRSSFVTLRNPLEGLSAQRVACMSCGYSEGLSMIPFNCLTLNFEVGIKHYNLFELLDNLVRLEPIQGVECVKCTLLEYRKGLQRLSKAVPAAAERLQAIEEVLEDDEFDDKILKKLKIPDSKKVSSTKTKQVVIGRPPPSLVMHMNRSVFDPSTFSSYKNLAAVEFPKTLDLGPWCIGSAEGKSAASAAVAGKPQGGDHPDTTCDEEKWVLDARASMVAGDAHPSKISGPIYELRAVVTHYGRHENGHYVCYKRGNTGMNDAYKADDEVGDLDAPPHLVGDEDPNNEVGGVNNNNNNNNRSAADEASAPPGEAEEQGPYDDDPDSKWWRLSDETVYEVQEKEVLEEDGVFMLFYDCVDPNSVLAGAAHEPTEPTETEGASVVEPTGQSWSEDLAATLCNAPAAEKEPAGATAVVVLERDSQGASPANLFGILSGG
ncbi:ubiquitin carboxyl-terminal hydrolase [Diaporthe helianthi]|uniref:ubiquitinyl hydrolase 1 n=1 Tax=Diaporthe helianthi TaxID=158607 RepID=A0A2P5IB29_DIAHE|nr:ubiquitin carboxyl-terminal hydrolase [Diaporthe helianthi]